MNKYFLILVIFSLLISSCKKDEPSPEYGEFNKGIFILNEGNYTAGNSSLCFYDTETDSVKYNVFQRINTAPLGDVANNLTLNKESIYIVVNNSGTVYKANRKTLEYQSKTDQLTSPREIIIINDSTALISDLYENYLTIINPADMSKKGMVNIGRTSENLLLYEDKIFVSNWSKLNQNKANNMIMVLNAESLELIDSIQVGIEPNSMVIDKNNKLWVLCSGGFMNEENASIHCVNTNTLATDNILFFSNLANSPSKLCIDAKGENLYYLNKDIFKQSISDDKLNEVPLFTAGNFVNFYSLGISYSNEIYAGDANDYNRSGTVYRLNNQGDSIASFKAGIIPGDFAFTVQ